MDYLVFQKDLDQAKLLLIFVFIQSLLFRFFFCYQFDNVYRLAFFVQYFILACHYVFIFILGFIFFIQKNLIFFISLDQFNLSKNKFIFVHIIR